MNDANSVRDSDLVSVADYARMKGIKISAVYARIRRGKLYAVKKGSGWKVDVNESVPERPMNKEPEMRYRKDSDEQHIYVAHLLKIAFENGKSVDELTKEEIAIANENARKRWDEIVSETIEDPHWQRRKRKKKNGQEVV